MTIKVPQSENKSFCPLCNGRHLNKFWAMSHKENTVCYSICNFCGFVFQNPTCTSSEWNDFYSQYYRAMYDGDAEPTLNQGLLQQRRAEFYADYLHEHSSVITGSNHLDIGSSLGTLLETVRNRFGTNPVGVEPGDAYRAHCKKSGIEAFSSVEELALLNRKFEIVTIMHVLEHQNEPVKFLRFIRDNFMTDNSVLLIEVPNLEGGPCFEIAHPVCFTRKSLSEALCASGFSVSKTFTHGKPRTNNPKSSKYMLTLAKPDFSGSNIGFFKKLGFVRKYTLPYTMWRNAKCDESILKFLVALPYRIFKNRGFPKFNIQ